MKKLIILALLMGMTVVSVHAQRVIDKLDRGVVAVKTTSGVFVSWRIQSDEYYDVTYNLYRDGSLVAEGLTVSNYTDAAGTTASSYTIEAVKRGVKQPMSLWSDTDSISMASAETSMLYTKSKKIKINYNINS